MKFNGKNIPAPPTVPASIYRGTEELVFQFGAIMDDAEFDKLVPVPEPPKIILTGGGSKLDYQDKTFLKAKERRTKLRGLWSFWKSISATEGLEFEGVDPQDPDTWENMEKELAEAFTQPEQQKLYEAFFQAQLPSKLSEEAAMGNFTVSQQGQDILQSFQTEELESIVSGEPAND